MKWVPTETIKTLSTIYCVKCSHFIMWFVTEPRVGWGGGAFYQHFGRGGLACSETWNQLDLRFCQNRESKRFKNNEKGVRLVRLVENQGEFDTKCFNWPFLLIWANVRSNYLYEIIFGYTSCRDNFRFMSLSVQALYYLHYFFLEILEMLIIISN